MCKKIILLMLLTLVCVCAACKNNADNAINESGNKNGNASVPADITATPEAAATLTPTPTLTPTSTLTPTPTVLPTNTPTPIPSPTPTPEVDDGRNEYWKETSTINYLPYYSGGVFLEGYSLDTFDYAVFESVSYADAESYWQKLKMVGFKADSETKVEGSSLWIYAENKEEIICTLSYEQSRFVISCGYFTKIGDGRSEYWSNTGFMSQLPYFSAGVFESYSATDYYDYMFYSNVTEAEAESYVHVLKAAGYEGTPVKSETELLFDGYNGSFRCDFKYDIKEGKISLAAGLPIID